MGLLQNFLFTEKAVSRAVTRSQFVEQIALWFGGGTRYASGVTGLRLGPIWQSPHNLSFVQATNKGYKAIVWVRACVDVIGKSLGAAEWHVYKKGSNKPIPNHDIEVLLNRPNPYQDKSEFFQAMAGYLSLAGNDYMEKVVVTNRAQGGLKVKQLWHMRPDWIAPVPDPLTFVRCYVLNTPTVTNEEVDVQRVMHLKYFDPLNPYVGISPISSAYRSIYAEEGASEWNQALFDNYAAPSGILSTEGTMVPEDRIALKEEILQEYTGANRFNPMVLWGGLKWQQITLSHEDVQFLEQTIKNKEEICAVMGVPAVMVGAVADPSYSNAAQARLSFWEDRIDPMLRWICAKFNNDIVQPYYGDDVELRYDISNVPAFRKALSEKTATAKILITMGFPLNDVNQKLKLGMDPVPWGDVAWMPTSVMPVDEDGVDRLLMGEDPGNPNSGLDNQEEPDPNADDPNAINGEEDTSGDDVTDNQRNKGRR